MRLKTLILISILLMINSVYATEMGFEQAKKLIDSGISCDKLSNDQLELMGDYYMEQIHPGEAHEVMDKMMGGEGSNTLGQMHINIAKRIYCSEKVDGYLGFMGPGMMMGNNMYGMMGGFGNSYGYLNIINLLYIILLVSLIILIFLGIKKLATNKKVSKK